MRERLRMLGRSPDRRPSWIDEQPARKVWSPFRRRIDNVALRWHARLDSPFADRSLPWILAGTVFVVFTALAVARVRSLEPSDSLARYAQAVEQLHGRRGTDLSLVPAGVAAPQPLLHLDGSLLFYPLGWLVGFLPTRQALVTLQSAALSVAMLPLWRLARRVANLRVGATTAVVVAYALFPPVHLMNTGGFDPIVLATPALFVMVHRALSGDVYRFAAAAVVALLCSMQLALVLVGFGVLLLFSLRPRAGLGLIVLGTAAAVGEQTVTWLGAGDHAFVDGLAFAPGTRSAIGVLGHGLVHPVDSLGHLGEERTLLAVVALLLPVALLPVMAFRHLAPVVPLQVAYLLGDLPERDLLGPQAVAATVFVFAATTMALERLGRHGRERVSVPPRLSGALVGVAALFFVLDSPASPYRHPWDWGSRDRLDGVREAWTDAVLAAAEDARAGDGDAPSGTAPRTSADGAQDGDGDGDDERAPQVAVPLPADGAEPVVAATSDMTPLLARDLVVCTLPLERHDCPAPPDVYLVDRELDPATPASPALEVVTAEADGRLVLLRPRPPA